MKQTGTSASTLLAAVIVVMVIFAFYRRSADDGRTPAERQQIADALFSMMHSSAAAELDDLKMDAIRPDDPRIPPVIRALHPVRFTFSDSAAVVYCAGTPAEYILRRGSRTPKIWSLYIAGPDGINCRELLHFEHD